MSTSEGANDDHKAPRYSSTITSMASSFRGSQPTSMGPLAIEGPSRQEDAESQAPRHSSTMTSMASSFRGSQRTSIGPLAIEGPSRQEDAESQGFPALEAGKAEETLDPHFVNDFVEDPPIPLPETLWWLSLVACAVLGNVLAIGLEVDLGCLDCPLTPTVCQERSLECVEGEELPYRSSQWLLSDVVFTSFFVVDILVRVFSYGPKVFFKGVETKKKVIPFAVYNMLDVAVVCTRPADLIINLAGIAIPVRILSMMRVYQCLALIKGLRKSSKSTLFTELWLIAKGAQNVMLTVVWVFVLMLLLVWAVACVLTLYVGHSDCIEEIEYGLVSTWTAQEYWGTVPRSVYTIFQILTLDRWASQIIWPVVKRLPAVSIIIFLFLCVGVLSLMSLIIGNIVENTITSSKENREQQDKDKEVMQSKILASLRGIFMNADGQKAGKINREQLRGILRQPLVQARLQMLELPPRDLDMLFTLFDEGSGLVKTDLFFRGCTRMLGDAMASDMRHLIVELSRNMKMVENSIISCSDLNADIAKLCDEVEAVDRDIIRTPADNQDEVLVARRARIRRPRASQIVSQEEDSPSEAPNQDLGIERSSALESLDFSDDTSSYSQARNSRLSRQSGPSQQTEQTGPTLRKHTPDGWTVRGQMRSVRASRQHGSIFNRRSSKVEQATVLIT